MKMYIRSSDDATPEQVTRAQVEDIISKYVSDSVDRYELHFKSYDKYNGVLTIDDVEFLFSGLFSGRASLNSVFDSDGFKSYRWIELYVQPCSLTIKFYLDNVSKQVLVQYGFHKTGNVPSFIELKKYSLRIIGKDNPDMKQKLHKFISNLLNTTSPEHKEWPSNEVWSSLDPYSELFEDYCNMYLSNPENFVNNKLNVFPEPSIQGWSGSMVIHDNSGKNNSISIDYGSWVDSEIELASSSNSESEYKKKYRQFLKDILNDNGWVV